MQYYNATIQGVEIPEDPNALYNKGLYNPAMYCLHWVGLHSVETKCNMKMWAFSSTPEKNIAVSNIFLTISSTFTQAIN